MSVTPESVHLILHYCDVWMLVVVLVRVNVWGLALIIEDWGQELPEESTIEQLSKSHVVRGNVNSELADNVYSY